MALTLAVRRAAGGRTVGRLVAQAEARMRAARDFLRAPVLPWIAPFWTALSIFAIERLVLGVGGRGVARGDSALEAAEVRLDGARQAAVLVALAQRARVPLLL